MSGRAIFRAFGLQGVVAAAVVLVAVVPGSATGPARVSRGRLRPVPVAFGDVVLVRDDSGSFRDVTPVHRPDEYVYDVSFVDEEHGWVGFTDPAAARGRLVRTVDGGRTWLPTNWTASVHHSAGSQIWLDFVDDRVGWASDYVAGAGAGGIFRTGDGGATWSDYTDLPAPGPIMFQNREHGWLAGWTFWGSTGPLYETLDGGGTWNERSVRRPDGPAAEDVGHRLPTFAGARGVLPITVGESKIEFYASSDGGQSWALAATIAAKGGAKAGIAVASPDVWWTISSDGGPAAVTEDAGHHWTTRRRLGLPAIVTDLDAKDASTAWATAGGPNDPGRLFETTDGGETWHEIGEPG